METMQYFNGFSLNNEQELFKDILIDTKYSVVGFSYGAIKAFEYTLSTSKRVDTLQLISPAFFQDKDKRFVRTQLLHFKKKQQLYIENFLNNCAYPAKLDLQSYLYQGSFEELEELLTYKWEEDKLKSLSKRVKISVYLGSEDKIIDSLKAYNFFKAYATIYYFNRKGHILK